MLYGICLKSEALTLAVRQKKEYVLQFLEEVVIILASEKCVQIAGGSSAATHFSGGL